MPKVKKLLNSGNFLEQVVIAMVLVVNSVIGGFSWVDLVWLAVLTVRLQVFDYNNWLITLSDYNCTEWLVKNKAANVPITFEETVIDSLLIKDVTRSHMTRKKKI